MRPISPPLLKRKVQPYDETSEVCDSQPRKKRLAVLPSPVQLTKITDLPATHNVDTVTLDDVLGDSLITECWNFNFLFNVDFFMYGDQVKPIQDRQLLMWIGRSSRRTFEIM